MHRLGIRTGADLKAQPLPVLEQHFGKAGPYFHAIARGIDHRPVRPDRIRKSVGAENTFCAGPLRVRRDETRAAAAHRQGLALVRELRRSWPHRDAESQVRRLPSDHPQPITVPRHPKPSAVGAHQSRPAVASAPTEQGVRLLGVTLSALARRNSTRFRSFPLPFEVVVATRGVACLRSGRPCRAGLPKSESARSATYAEVRTSALVPSWPSRVGAGHVSTSPDLHCRSDVLLVLGLLHPPSRASGSGSGMPCRSGS